MSLQGKKCMLVLCMALLVMVTLSFTPMRNLGRRASATRLFMAKGKGFGTTPPPPPPKKPQYNEESSRTVENPTTTSSSSSTDINLNQGQKALEEMRRQRAEQKDSELRKVREIKKVDEFLGENPAAAVIPEKVAMRMGKRMLPFVGLPLFGGMGAFVAFWYMATYQGMEFQPTLVAFTTLGILAVGLVGITFSLLSASWDEDREGSILGVEEFSKNVDELRGGLSRSRENALTRERMAGMSEAEIQRALRDLEKRETPKRSIDDEIKSLQD